MPEITDSDLRTIRCAASLLVAVTSAGGPATFRELKIRRTQECGIDSSPTPPAWLSATLLIIASIFSWLTTRMLTGYAGAVIWMLNFRVCSQSQISRVNYLILQNVNVPWTITSTMSALTRKP